MVDQIAMVEIVTPASTGVFNITNSAITETCVAALFLYAANASDGTDGTHGIIGFGACGDGTAASSANDNASYCTHGRNDAITAPDYNTARDTGDASSHCIVINSGTAPGTVLVNAFVVGPIANGIQINFDTTTAGIKIKVVLFAGIADSWIGTISSSAQSAEAVGGGGGFTPDVLFFFGGAGTFNTLGADAALSLGFAVRTSPIQQASAFVNFDDVTEPTDADGEVASTSGSVNHQGITRTQKHIRVDSFDAGGFTWTPVDGGTIGSMYLALKFTGNVRLACAAMAIAGATGDQNFNAFGFTPDLVVGITTLLDTLDSYTSGQLASAGGLFFTGRYGSRAVTMHGENGKTNVAAGSFNTHNRSEDVALLCYEHTGTIFHRATWVGGTGSGGFRLNFSAAAAGNMAALGIQLFPTTPVVRRVPRARKRYRMRYRRTSPPGGKTVTQGFVVVLRAIQRSWRAMRLRLRPRKPFQVPSNPAVFSDVVASPTGSVFAPAAVRGEVASGGSEAGSVF